jgi:hypothetical protein
MRLNGWTWLVSGLIVTIMSGYVYLFVPKNGQPNTAMALFFFIGIIFLVIGMTQLFFKRKDDKSVLDSIAKETPEQKIITMPEIETKQNKVEEAINQMLQQKSQETQSQNKPVQASSNTHASQHSNSFSQMYQFKGPAHTPASGTHTQHPVSQYLQQPEHATTNQTTIHNTPHHAAEQSPIHHPVQNAEHSLKCGKCGNVNPGHSNYCHKCGNRLK